MLDRITGINVALVAAMLALSSFAWTIDAETGFMATAGACVGGLIAVANFLIIRRTIGGMFTERPKVRKLPFFVYILKVLALFGAIAGTIVYLPIDILWFSAGLSTMIPAILLAGILEIFYSQNNPQQEEAV